MAALAKGGEGSQDPPARCHQQLKRRLLQQKSSLLHPGTQERDQGVDEASEPPGATTGFREASGDEDEALSKGQVWMGSRTDRL